MLGRMLCCRGEDERAFSQGDGNWWILSTASLAGCGNCSLPFPLSILPHCCFSFAPCLGWCCLGWRSWPWLMVFRQGCGTHRCVTHLHVCVCSGNGAECQEKYRLYRGIRLLCFVLGLEIQSHLLQMFPVEFIARSYCAALQEKTIKKIQGCAFTTIANSGKGIRGICSLLLP